jgi:3-hydroxyisobutyrate dehydrogenase
VIPEGPIGWIGLGAMGAPMARRLVEAGYQLRVWSRRPLEHELRLSLRDPEIAESPGELASTCSAVATIVGGPRDVETLYLGADGLLAGSRPGTILVDHTTSSPALAHRIGDAAAALGMATLDAPVSGGPTGAAAGSLSMMVGGDPGALERARPWLSCVAATIVHHGAVGSGQAAKLANQVLVAGSMLAIADARRVGVRAGLDDARLGDTLGAGIAGSALLGFAWDRAKEGDRSPGFAIDHLIKDLELVIELDPDAANGLVGLALLRYRALAATGHGRDGTQAILFDERSEQPA